MAIDVVGCGEGQLVLVVQGSSARMTEPTKNLPADSLYVDGYWARIGFVNFAGANNTAWPWNEPWECRCMRAPEWNARPDNAHPLKSHPVSGAGMSACMMDGSVRFIAAGRTDEQFCPAESPARGDFPQLEAASLVAVLPRQLRAGR